MSMLYTVKEVAAQANVTVKTLHHYHKIGLLAPCEISEAGYRLYGTRELERLQEILFYRELDFPLEAIKELLAGEPERRELLLRQEQLLLAHQRRLEKIIATLRKSVDAIESGEPLGIGEMFRGFETEEEWREALSEQRKHLWQAYDIDVPGDGPLDVKEMNEQAAEAAAFMGGMAEALQSGLKHDGESVRHRLSRHLAYMNEHGHAISAADFAAQTRFFLQDDFHRRMLEQQQTGLAYYLAAAAEAFAADQA